MKKGFNTKKLCRAGIIAALYVALTYAFLPFAFGPIQIRPAEALCILPLFFPEAVPALYIGCILSNLSSPYAFYDVTFGAFATLFGALGSYMVGRFFKKDWLRITLGGLFPVVCNALIIPFVIVFLYGEAFETSLWIAYISTAFSIFLTECIWIYGLGTPLYMILNRKQRSVGA